MSLFHSSYWLYQHLRLRYSVKVKPDQVGLTRLDLESIALAMIGIGGFLIVSALAFGIERTSQGQRGTGSFLSDSRIKKQRNQKPKTKEPLQPIIAQAVNVCQKLGIMAR
jgi:hypothetical protein